MSEWQLRPARPEDHPRVVAIVDAQDLAYRGQTDFTLEILRDQILSDSTVDADRDLVVVDKAGSAIAYGLFNGRTAFVGVQPEHEDPELRMELIAWAEARQNELGRTPYRGGCDAVHTPAVAAWIAAGYSLDHLYAQMILTFAETGPPPITDLPPGYRLRRTDRDTDATALHALNERAFSADPDYEPQTVEDFTRAHLTFSQFEPTWSLLVETTAGEPVGSLIGWRPPDHPHGYVAVLAVDPTHQRRGLARAMLSTACESIHAAGLPTAELYVASHNPLALDLYLSLGMREGERINNYTRTP